MREKIFHFVHKHENWPKNEINMYVCIIIFTLKNKDLQVNTSQSPIFSEDDQLKTIPGPWQ